MKIILGIIIYVILGAAIGGVHYYLQILKGHDNANEFMSIWTGVFWPFIAPFALAFYFAEKQAKERKKK